MSKLSSLSAERWRSLEPLIDAALDLPADQRAAFLRVNCPSDLSMHDELTEVLAQCARVVSAGSMLDRPAAEGFASLWTDGVDDSRLRADLAGRYTIEREAGCGGMAVVYRARDVRHNRFVALKVLRQTLGDDDVTRFRREVTLAAGLQHPHIVPVFDSGDADGRLWYTMPFVQGETLRARLERESPLDVREAIRLLREIADALAAAHSAGVVHRDLKPENILLSGGHAVIADFGIAKALFGTGVCQDGAQRAQTNNAHSSFMGTPLYMAPEQANEAAEIDERADLYAFGVIAYEMLAGHAPFSNRKRSELSIARARETPRPLSWVREVPPVLAALVDQCLAKRPADRPQSAREILRELDVASGPRLTFRRHHAAAAVAAAAVAAIGAAQYHLASPSETLDENRILVAPFQPVSGHPSLGPMGSVATTWIYQGLASIDPVQVISLSAVDKEMGGEEPSAVDLFAIARRLHAGTIITGTYSASGDSLRFQARIARTSSQETRGMASAAVGPAGDTLVAMNDLREQLLRAMGLSGWLARGKGVQIPKISAVREFIRAQQLSTLDSAAIPPLEHAIALDSTYVPAFILLATTRVERASADPRRWPVADSLVRRLEANRDRLSTNDRVIVEYLRARIDGDRETAYRRAREWAERDPSWLPSLLAGANAIRMNRVHAATSAFSAAVTAAGASPQRRVISQQWLAVAYHEAGDFLKEERVGEQLLAAALRAAAAQGRENQVNRMLAGVDSFSGSSVAPAVWKLNVARELRAHGFESAANEQLAKAKSWLQTHSVTETREVGLLVADIMFEMGRLDSASARYRALALDDSSMISIAALGRLGTTAALSKDTATAARIADRLAHLRWPYLHGLDTYWQAAIAASLGDKDRAVRLLDESLHRGVGMGLQIHVQREFLSLRDYPAFEVLMRPRSD